MFPYDCLMLWLSLPLDSIWVACVCVDVCYPIPNEDATRLVADIQTHSRSFSLLLIYISSPLLSLTFYLVHVYLSLIFSLLSFFPSFFFFIFYKTTEKKKSYSIRRCCYTVCWLPLAAFSGLTSFWYTTLLFTPLDKHIRHQLTRQDSSLYSPSHPPPFHLAYTSGPAFPTYSSCYGRAGRLDRPVNSDVCWCCPSAVMTPYSITWMRRFSIDLVST